MNQGGKTSSTRSKVYFGDNSNMLIHHISPINLFVLNNRDGELKIYNPEKNSVFQQMNYMINSENNQFYYFLRRKTDDMGLIDNGFTLINTELENGLLISEFDTPQDVKQNFDRVELVHEGKTPIFIGYKDKKGKYRKKVYFYEYEQIGESIQFPMSITEINYIDKDSIIVKSEFSNFQFDKSEDLQMVRFEVPESAILVE
jgi:hypothetical protein